MRIEHVVQTASSVIAFGHRGDLPVVLKVVTHIGDEWRSGEILEAFGGRGVVRALDHGEGAVLLERVLPGRTLANAPLPDADATAIIAGVIAHMDPGPPPPETSTIEWWARSFDQYLARDTNEIPLPLVTAAQQTYRELCATQSAPRLLHGDLHHDNLLLDAQRGWLAIDPKGVVGEVAYEVGAAFRNPVEHPEVFTAPAAIDTRANCFAQVLWLDKRRILAWAFAQAVLSAIWDVEDYGELRGGASCIALASAIRSIQGDLQ